MARSYEYVIHGRSPSSNEGSPVPHRKTLSTTRDPQRKSNLRHLYRASISSNDYVESPEPLEDRRLSSPTTPKLPPTPPTGEEEGGEVKEEAQPVQDSDAARLRSIPVTPVNQYSPPTPDDTPPREQLKLPIRPFLTVRPSVASTQAESFRTARENIYSEDESDHFSPEQRPNLASPAPPPELPLPNGDAHTQGIEDVNGTRSDEQLEFQHNDTLPSSSPLPAENDNRRSQNTVVTDKDTPETQFQFDHLEEQARRLKEQAQSTRAEATGSRITEVEDKHVLHAFNVHERVTVPAGESLKKQKTLRDRVKATKQIQSTASIEAFANVIGWNDGGGHHDAENAAEANRWSGISNPSAVEAYVVDSPIQPRKRGTLRKVIKNDSLRSTSSPIPESKRTSLQSTSDSSHRLVHKKLKLNNENRWSAGSEISKRSLSWGFSPIWSRQEVIKVAVIPERGSSLQTSASSSRRHSRSISGGSTHINGSMPPVTTPMPRRKAALSHPQDTNTADGGPPQIPARSTSLSAPTSRNGSRANSITSHHLSIQREQAEKDLRSTLERMESERLSASLRRSSHQSSSPTPAPRQVEKTHQAMLEPNVTNTEMSRKNSSAAGSARSHQKSVTIDLGGIDPGTKEWADLRPATLTGTPFSQASMLSTSPEIVEARAISFFPHNNQSLQLIEPNRLSETPAVKALRAQGPERAQTLPARAMNITTPRTSDRLLQTVDNEVDSPLRNPRKPPQPPQVQFSIIPPTPMSERDHQLGATPDTSPVKSRTGTLLRKRPSLQGRDRSESFIKSLGRNLSLRNAKNPKQDQDLDSTLYPFWRPRAFWDDDDYRRRMQQEHDREQMGKDGTTVDAETGTVIARSLVVHEPHSRLVRSNTITTGPMSLVRKMSERRKQRRMVDEHIAGQQALVKQTSYSSLQRFRAGRKLYGLPPIRSLSLNMGVGRLSSLRDKMTTARARREDERRELRREKLRKSIGPDVVSQGDSRFPTDMMTEHNGGRKAESEEALGDMLERARAEEVVGKRGLRM
ncbi:hypothetical protein PMZ80_009269 [Knufia obscura]|uniref:Uncharacterized protein n=2 Tax=Knufia TaxID=430999 RepID=A0AAN8EGD6_9EURO|nr:hypothetical protein PMZ80_009269 [Knufia obscura]KAK5948990.1 hypothetical protein OHC33_009911 [Knufia fluminis]